MPDSFNPVDVRRAAMDLLARREHGRKELKQKLSRRFKDSTVVEEQIARLTEEGLQSDERLAESFVRFRIGRGQGPLKILNELRRKGIDESLARESVEDADVDWLQLARDVHDRRFGDHIDDHEVSRRVRFLQQRGFEFDQIRPVVKL